MRKAVGDYLALASSLVETHCQAVSAVKDAT